MSEAKPVRIALLGCGTVGGGVLRLLRQNQAYLASRVGAPLEVRHVLVRDTTRPREEGCEQAWITDDAGRILEDDSLDVLVEVMGGEQRAGELIERGLQRGLGVVTANKFLLARRGPELLDLAVKQGTDLAFEASVGGGIPVIRTLREALTSDWVERLDGIVNGTCNYMLTRMREDGWGFEEALREAQRLGYAEAEPSLDVDGHDAAQKLVVLAMLAFGARVREASVPVQGIRAIDAADHRFAERFGYRIKHLAVGRDHGGHLELRVHPALVPTSDVLASVSGVLNAIRVEGRALGPCLLSGRGAGAMPTAVSVVADLVDVARARIAGVAGLATRGIQMAERALLPLQEVSSPFYLRFSVQDRPGVLAAIAGSLGDNGVSIEQMVQTGAGEGPVDIVMTTHRARWGGVEQALVHINQQDFTAKPGRFLPILQG
ncbi:MAG: homoserine dehydrogenase [Polyangiaceae bacterium]|jgi:homoserine dehydrogenase|nr:homoserine dehydrogenase [Polyangiaceae bacterium]